MIGVDVADQAPHPKGVDRMRGNDIRLLKGWANGLGGSGRAVRWSRENSGKLA